MLVTSFWNLGNSVTSQASERHHFLQSRFLVWHCCRRVSGHEAAFSGAQRRHRGPTVRTANGHRAGVSTHQPGSHLAGRSAAYNLLGPGKLE